MIPNTKKHKLIKLAKSKRSWGSDPEETSNPFGRSKAEKEQRYMTVCYRIPTTAQYVETIWKDGEIVWERSQGSTFNTAILGGGGRFWWRRKWFNRKLVAIELEFKDVPLRGGAEPNFEIAVRV